MLARTIDFISHTITCCPEFRFLPLNFHFVQLRIRFTRYLNTPFSLGIENSNITPRRGENSGTPFFGSTTHGIIHFLHYSRSAPLRYFFAFLTHNSLRRCDQKRGDISTVEKSLKNKKYPSRKLLPFPIPEVGSFYRKGLQECLEICTGGAWVVRKGHTAREHLR